MLDACIKRFKSVSFATLIALLVGLGLASSRSGLADANREAQRWLWTSFTLNARLEEGSAIESIGGVDQDTWREQHPGLPKFGKVLDVVRNLTETEVVKGRLSAHGTRIIEFQSQPLPIDHAGCLTKSKATVLRCNRYLLSQREGDEEIAHFLYHSVDGGQGVWSALDWATATLVDFTAAEDRVLRISEPWVGKRDSAGAAFDALVERLNSQTIKLPVLNLDLPARLASAALALFALVSSYLGATSLAGLDRCYDAAAQREPWILQRRTMDGPKWTDFIRDSLTWMSRVSVYAQIWLPALLFAVAFRLSPTNSSSLLVAACAVPSLFMLAYSTGIFRTLLGRLDPSSQESNGSKVA